MADFNNTGPVTVYSLVDSLPKNAALKSGQVSSPVVNFKFADVVPVTSGFGPFVRELKYDFGELAIVTYLQAMNFGKPLVLLPFVMVGNFRHDTIIYNASRGELSPADLVGRKVGIRAYTQTSGAWIRGILENDYGVDLSKVTWVCADPPHVTEYQEPGFIVRPAPGKKLLQMLADGEIDAAIGVGVDALKDTRFKPLIPDAKATAMAWHKRHGIVPINHMAVVKKDLYEARPDVVKEIFRLLVESKKAGTPANETIDLTPFGVEPNRKSLETIIDYAVQQKLIPRHVDVDDLFDDTTRALGA